MISIATRGGVPARAKFVASVYRSEWKSARLPLALYVVDIGSLEVGSESLDSWHEAFKYSLVGRGSPWPDQPQLCNNILMKPDNGVLAVLGRRGTGLEKWPFCVKINVIPFQCRKLASSESGEYSGQVEGSSRAGYGQKPLKFFAAAKRSRHLR